MDLEDFMLRYPVVFTGDAPHPHVSVLTLVYLVQRECSSHHSPLQGSADLL